MLSKGKLCIIIVALFIILTCIPVCADNGGYVVRPMTPDEIAAAHENMATGTGDDRALTFWELPLWIQLSYASALIAGALGALFVIFNVVPFFLIKTKRMADNKNREKIYGYINENPGCTVNDISRGQSMNVGSVRYHVQRLGTASRIILVRVGKFTRLFRNSGVYDEREIVVLSAMNIRTNRAIVLLIRQKTGLTNKEIADGLEIKESMAHLYLTHLLKDDIIRFVRNGQQKQYYLVDDVEPILKKAADARATSDRRVTA